MTKDLEWARDIMQELDYEQRCTTKVLEDNAGCVYQSINCKRMKRARNYMVPLAKLNEMVGSGFMHIHQTLSERNCADLCLPRDFRLLLIGGIQSTPLV